ncbi:ring-cleaving dioxygenase [Mesobaculum littorinae]|uniref:Ring-cleaving dioxygenase n=1 Tax=Mesobaculum littorinae TaxID=2486419 RepID=A0A438ADC3_9RHOB|nr:VOC family protein [Mesobaculum littorinae]RVV96691.1 ring-cleaving dioxygenase [Mesobaculum littorinae]
MPNQIQGIHHVTSLASDARAVDSFFTAGLGLRRVKKTVNFDAPDVYHLYYGDAVGTPGSVMTYFPFPDAARGRRGSGEVGETRFAVPPGSLPAWRDRLEALDAAPRPGTLFDAPMLGFSGPDGDGFALVEAEDDRTPWDAAGIAPGMAVRGFHSARLDLADIGPTADLLALMGFARTATRDGLTRFEIANGNGAHRIDLRTSPDGRARQGAGSVHHIAFSVPDSAAQDAIRTELEAAGLRPTPQIDRDYFQAIYFRSPGGVLFEIATDAPGFDRDEPRETLGTALCLPAQHAHLRDRLEQTLPPLD